MSLHRYIAAVLSHHPATQPYIHLCYTAERGRHVVARQFIPAGTVLFTEQSIVSAEIQPINAHCIEQLQSIAAMHQYDERRLFQVYNLLHSSTAAELLAVCVELCQSHAHNQSHAVERKRQQVAETMYETVYASSKECLVTAELIRQLLNVLDTNCHELSTVHLDTELDHNHINDVDALFPLLACFNHACCENCAYTAYSERGSTISVSCIADIEAGTELCVNYIDRYYPTQLKQSYLQYNYQFRCTCQLCTSDVDQSRAFRCVHCSTGIVYARQQQYVCTSASCGKYADKHVTPLYQLVDASVIDLTAADQPLLCADQTCTPPPLRIAQVAEVVKYMNEAILVERLNISSVHTLYVLLHSSHYGVHAAINIIADEMTVENRLTGAIAMCWLLLDNLDTVYGADTMHWRKSIQYDRLAYLYAAQGDTKQARQAVECVYKINRYCFGEEVLATQSAKHRLLQLTD